MHDDQGKVIFGTDLSSDTYDEIMFAHLIRWLRINIKNPNVSSGAKIDGEARLELDLFRKKWFCYRFLHPVAATYLYAHFYQIAYRRTYARNVNRGTAEYIRIFSNEDIFKCDPPIVTSMWKGRQIADAIGAPYEFVIESAMRNTLRYWKQPHLPRPGQIYNDWVCETIVKEWEENKRFATPHSDHQEYRTHRYVGTREQNDHHEHLMELAGMRADPEPILNRFFEDELLPIEKILARFGVDISGRILQATEFLNASAS
jgi:hypothetical protein